MQVFKVLIPPQVQQKIKDQAYVIAMDKPSAALKWYDTIQEKLSSLEQMPKRCPIAPESIHFDFEVRHLISGRYRILFAVQDDSVKVLDFKAGQQNKP